MRHHPDHHSLRLLEHLERCTLEPGTFDHRAHVRATWALFAGGASADEVDRRLSRALRAFAAGAGAPDKFDARLTRAWVDWIDDRYRPRESFETFAAANPDLFAAGARPPGLEPASAAPAA